MNKISVPNRTNSTVPSPSERFASFHILTAVDRDSDLLRSVAKLSRFSLSSFSVAASAYIDMLEDQTRQRSNEKDPCFAKESMFSDSSRISTSLCIHAI